MLLRRALSVLLIIAATASLSSCEKVEYFKSEKNVREELKGSWNLVPIPRTNPAQTWTFSDDLIYRKVMNSNGVMVPADTGRYVINTSLMKVVFVTEGFTPAAELDADWHIVQLDKDFLIIATDYYDTKGIYELEFTRAN
jgi:hypothetical protein